MNYEEMSDFEINGAVAAIVTGGIVVGFDDMAPAPTDDGVQVIYRVGVSGEFLDYCNNPNDAWPIIFQYGICITSPTVGRKNKIWSASWNEDGGRWSSGDIKHGDENPLRAAMIIFLMMKDAEK